MIIPNELTIKIFGERYYNTFYGLNLQRNFYKLRKLNLWILSNRGIKTYAQFSKLVHEYIGFVDEMDIYNYWEGITFKEIMNEYVDHIILVLDLNELNATNLKNRS